MNSNKKRKAGEIQELGVSLPVVARAGFLAMTNVPGPRT